jgi:hypothetical protein
MPSQPLKPFQDAREVIKSRLSIASRAPADQARGIALTYRVSGGPPGKRLLQILRVAGEGDVTYEHQDELHKQKPVRTRMVLPPDEVMALFRQVYESGILELRDPGAGFLPDSVIGAIVIESDGAQVANYFLAEEHQQISQNKSPSAPIASLRPKFEALCEAARKSGRNPRKKR